jgi:hypothetical protein
MNGRLTFTIERLRFKPGKFCNSPPVLEWRRVGRWRARSAAEALARAEIATGECRTFLRVAGVSFTAR